MDNFLHSFKNKINQAEEPDAHQRDWESFKAFRQAAKSKRQFSILNGLNKKRIGAIAAIFFLGISLFAYFALPKKQSKPEISMNQAEHRKLEELKLADKKIEATIPDHSNWKTLTDNGVKVIDNTNNVTTGNSGHTSTTKTPLAQAKKMLANLDQKPTGLSKVSGQSQGYFFSGNLQKNEELTNDKYTDEAIISGPNEGKIVEWANADNGNLSDQNISLTYTQIQKLNTRQIAVINLQNTFTLPIYMPDVSTEKPGLPRQRFQISGAARFNYAIKDRIDASFYLGKHLAASYYMTDKLSFGINWTNSKYTLTIPNKDQYPVLEDINPRSVSDTLEELTVNASMTKLGLELNYELLNYTKIKSGLGLGISRDISTKHDFRMKVRDRNGKPELQHQNKNIIAKSRVFISPALHVAYNAYDNFWVYGKAQYDISLSKYQEKYLAFDLGLAYVF